MLMFKIIKIQHIFFQKINKYIKNIIEKIKFLLNIIIIK